MLHNEALGQQTLNYQWWMLVPKAAIPQSNNLKQGLTGRNLG